MNFIKQQKTKNTYSKKTRGGPDKQISDLGPLNDSLTSFGTLVKHAHENLNVVAKCNLFK